MTKIFFDTEFTGIQSDREELKFIGVALVAEDVAALQSDREELKWVPVRAAETAVAGFNRTGRN